MNSRPKPATEEQRRLRGATAWQRKPAPAPESIGSAIEQFLAKRRPLFKRTEKVAEMWEALLPEAIRKHCRLAGFVSGVLTVEVSAGPFLHQLQMIRGRLLEEIQNQCPQSGVRDIRIMPGCINQE